MEAINNSSLLYSLLQKKHKATLHLNTNGCCFWCLKDNYDNSSNNYNNFVKKTLLFPMQNLCNYLNINVKKKADNRVAVKLCLKCHKIAKKFTKLYLQLEKLQIELDHCIDSIQKQITEPTREPKLLQKYWEKMSSDEQALTQLPLVVKLRKQMEKQTLHMRRGPLAKIHLEKVKTPNKMEKTSKSFTEIPLLEVETPLIFPPQAVIEAENVEDSEPLIEQKVYLNVANKTRDPSPITIPINSTESLHNNGDLNAATTNPVTTECSSLSKPNTSLETSLECQPSQSFNKNQIIPEADLNKQILLKTQTIAEYHFNKKTKLFRCTACNKKYITRNGVVLHYRTRHTFKKCRFCHRGGFHSVQSVQNHFRTCSIRKLVIKTPSYPQSVKKSSKTVSFDEDTGLYNCSLCDKVFGYPASLRYHYKVAHLLLNFKCNLCQSTFKTQWGLARHKKICKKSIKKQPKVKKFSCLTCGKQFMCKEDLKTHLKTVHTHEKLEKCEKCHKTYLRKAALRQHEQDIHSGILQKCQLCNKTFSSKRAKDKHFKIICKFKMNETGNDS